VAEKFEGCGGLGMGKKMKIKVDEMDWESVD
jgi:hypothetical protein